jgi:hypothetical protein
MIESDAYKNALMYLRLAAECKNLTAYVPAPHRAHYLRMASLFEELALEPDAESSDDISISSHFGHAALH